MNQSAWLCICCVTWWENRGAYSWEMQTIKLFYSILKAHLWRYTSCNIQQQAKYINKQSTATAKQLTVHGSNLPFCDHKYRAMKAILCFLLIFLFSVTEQTTAQRDVFPPWFVPDNRSSTGCSCSSLVAEVKCGVNFTLLRFVAELENGKCD